MLRFTHLPKALRWLRIDQGRRQREVAEAAGISASMLSGYEKGTRVPSLESLARLLNALGISLARLEELLARFDREGRIQGDPAAARPAAVDRPYPLPGEILPASALAEPGPAGQGREPGVEQTLALLRTLQRLLEGPLGRRGEEPGDPAGDPRHR